MQILDAYNGPIRSLSFSAEGSHLALTGGTGYSITLWSLTQRRRERVLARGFHRAVEAAFATRGTALVACNGHDIWVWDDLVSSDRPARSFPGRVAAFRGDGRALAYLTKKERAVCLLDWATGDEDRTTLPLTRACTRLAWSPTGEALALFTARDVTLRQLGTGDLRDLPSAGALLRGLAFSPCGRWLARAAGPVVLRWEVATAAPVPPLRGHARAVQAIGYLPDGRLLSCGNDGSVRTWDDATCVAVKNWELGELTTLAVARDGMRAAVGSKRGTILIWDLD